MNKKQQTPLYIALTIAIVALMIISFLKIEPESQRLSPMEQALSFYQNGDYKQAEIYFAQADNANIPEASFALGALYFSGKGVPVNISKALNYYEKAAENNYAPAQTTLALLYMQGDVVPRDAEKAIGWAEKAAESNDMDAQIMLARWFENGEYIERDMEKAVYFYKKAALNGDINAKTALSIIYKTGRDSVLPNIYTSKKWEDSIQKQKRFENIFQNRPADYIEKALQ